MVLSENLKVAKIFLSRSNEYVSSVVLVKYINVSKTNERVKPKKLSMNLVGAEALKSFKAHANFINSDACDKRADLISHRKTILLQFHRIAA